MEYHSATDCLNNLLELSEEYKALDVSVVIFSGYPNQCESLADDPMIFQTLNKEYVTKLEEVSELQEKCVKQVAHHKYRLGVISRSLKK